MKQRREMLRVGHEVGHDSLGGVTRNKGLRLGVEEEQTGTE